MIRRDADDHFILIAQHDHALLAGKLAGRIGNSVFMPPSPAKAVIDAVSLHDCGWVTFDKNPTLNPQGFPSHVFEIDLRIALGAWTDCVEQVFAGDRYTNLLISLHVMALAARAADRQAAPVDEAARDLAFRLQQFIHRQIELQELFRNELKLRIDLPLRGGLAEPGRSDDEDLLHSNFFLLEFLDQVSLTLCFDRLIFEKIHPLQPRPNEWPLTIRTERDTDGSLRLDPWPFNVERITLPVPARRIPKIAYSDNLALQSASEKTESIDIEVNLKTWQSD